MEFVNDFHETTTLQTHGMSFEVALFKWRITIEMMISSFGGDYKVSILLNDYVDDLINYNKDALSVECNKLIGYGESLIFIYSNTITTRTVG